MNSPALCGDGTLAFIIHRVEDVTEFVMLKQAAQRDAEQSGMSERFERMETEVFARAQEIRAANIALEERNREIVALNERVERLDRMKTEFFANVSHELRTPLMLILGPADHLLQRGPLDIEVRECLEIITRNARSLLGQVENLLEVARLDANKARIRYARVDLAALIRTTASQFESIATARGQTLHVDVPATLDAVVDPEKVERVLLNLLSNACKFTPRGGRVRCVLTEDRERAVLLVEDSGPGVSEGLREAVFERFFQAESTSRASLGGAGIGLAIVRDLLDLHGGSVGISDAPEGGATFKVELPLVPPHEVVIEAYERRVDAEPAAQPEPPVAPPEQTVARPAPSTAPDTRRLVLVVDDNADMREYIGRVLSSEYRVAGASDGREGLERAARLKPDALLTDVMMPEMNGEQLLGALRASKELAEIPVVVLSARADDAMRARLLRAGAHDYLVKPFSAEELRARLANLLERRQARAEIEYLYEHAPCGYHALDPEDRVLRINDTELHWLGYARDEVIGRPFREFFSQASQALRAEALEHLRRVGDVHGVELELVRRSGTILPVVMSGVADYDSEGRVFRTRMTLMDVTEVRRARAERERVIVELQEALSNVRTLSGLVPICSWCKKVRNDDGYYQQLEAFVCAHTDAKFTHGICPECALRLAPKRD